MILGKLQEKNQPRSEVGQVRYLHTQSDHTGLGGLLFFVLFCFNKRQLRVCLKL